MVCSVCNIDLFCSEECHIAHWPKHNVTCSKYAIIEKKSKAHEDYLQAYNKSVDLQTKVADAKREQQQLLEVDCVESELANVLQLHDVNLHVQKLERLFQEAERKRGEAWNKWTQIKQEQQSGQ